jgi:beta-phosphoglucomutase
MKAVIFDMDGVIIDSISISDKLLGHTAKQFGVHLTEKQLHELHGISGQSFWKYLKHTYNLPESVEYYINKYDVEEEIRLYKDLKPISGIPQLIDDLRKHKIPLALATSASKYRMNKFLELFQMQKTFDAIICADDVSQAKPNPEIFLKAAAKLSINPTDCIVIEDAVNGYKAATQAGMKCIL